ncbi:EamA-like transporter family protein [Quadrisphaera granulorum]|uniref:EamA-like transporter family protein n=1 Tax=Quadrisphaera granulorum TaxID=317664 RepID=A0A315ZTC0_9ACTN|nr:DMT family transporter [Quadrisphaera granulorum]PWJ48806.1 EamA-like transporter family protein [Quadrisphaera granulorum]SZE98288.1 EamA-like transporter family protein [Quadrisphaera granulorum]
MPTSGPPLSRRQGLGLLAMALTVLVWASFALSIRAIATSSWTPADVALLRFGLPLLVLAPWLPRALRRVRGERPAVLAALAIGAGLPYFLVCAAGGAMSSATLVGVVVPGSVPVFVTALVAALWGASCSRRQLVALAGVVVGIVVIAGTGGGSSGSHVAGTAVLLAAGLVWSVYTLGLRATRLDPVSAAVVVCLPSFVVVLLASVTGLLPSHLLAGASVTRELLMFAAVQGVGVGVLAGLAYAVAIRELGAPRAATIGALSPVLVAVLAVPLLGEHLDARVLVGGVLVVASVLAFHVRPVRRARSVSPEVRDAPRPAAPVSARPGLVAGGASRR